MDQLSDAPGFIDLTEWSHPGGTRSFRSSSINEVAQKKGRSELVTVSGEKVLVLEDRELILKAIKLDQGRVRDAAGGNPFK